MINKHNVHRVSDESESGANTVANQEDQQQTSTVDDETKAAAPDFPIVGIGASAGGLRAIEDFFGNMPPQNGAAFIVIQHLSPDFKSLMNELLERRTQMNVYVAIENMPLKPDTIFLIPPGQNMVLRGDKLHLSPQERQTGSQLHFPIDLFFESLAQDESDRVISIILSGTGSDGSCGIQKVSEAGGIVLVQEPSTAEFDGMPRSSIATGLADLILPAHAIANATYQFITSVSQRQAFKTNHNKSLNPSMLQEVVNILETYENIDFTHYKSTTLTRRIKRRCLIAGHSTLANYIQILKTSEAERNTLRNDLLITVTRFFRDIEAWRFLESTIVPELVKRAADTKTLRVWVTACATGEEAYSLAMLIQEAIDRLSSPVRAKIFATDIDAIALAKASAGIYPREVIASLSQERRDRFFTVKEDLVEVSKSLREMIIFANHNLTKDASFTQMDLVSCRNVLIYMQPQLQQHVLRNLHFSLKVGSILFLGESENLGTLAEEFTPRQKKWKIYQKLRDARLPLRSPTFASTNAQVVTSDASNRQIFNRAAKTPKFDPLLEIAFESLLRNRRSTCFLVDRDSQLIHLCCDSLGLIKVATGRASRKIEKMMPESLRMPLNSALHRAWQKTMPVSFKNCQVLEDNIAVDTVTIEASLQKSLETGSFVMVIIEPRQHILQQIAEPTAEGNGETEKDQYVIQLQQALTDTQENLQSTIEELETTNEEQQSTHEELIASNEELQSTNEELHSVNEELHTVNAEYQSKIQELTRLNNDLDNLLDNIDIGVIFLDRDLRIRKFTPAVRPAFNLLSNDIGRPIVHLSHTLEDFDLQAALHAAQQQQGVVEYEVRVSNEGIYLLLHIYPYLSETGEQDGLIITLVNVDDIKKSQTALSKAQEDLRETNEKLEQEVRDRTGELKDSQQMLQSITQATPSGIYIYDLIARKNIYANAFVERLLGYSPEQAKSIGEDMHRQIFHPDDFDAITEHYQRIQKSQVDDDYVFEIEYRVKNADSQWRHFYSQEVIFERSPTGEPTKILGISLDISDNKSILLQLQNSEVRYRTLYQNNPIMMHTLDHEGNILSVNNAWMQCSGYQQDEVVGKPISNFLHRSHSQAIVSDETETEQETEQKPEQETVTAYTLTGKDQQAIDVLLYTVREQDESDSGLEQQLIGMIDVTERNRVQAEFDRYREHLEELVNQRADEIKQSNQKLRAEVAEREQAQSALAQHAQELERSNSSLEEFAYVVSHDLQEPLRAMTVFSQLLSQRYQQSLDDTAGSYINNIVEGGIRMQALIDGILDFSRISHRPQQLQPVALNTTVEAALSNLSSTIKTTEAEITVEDLPTVLGDKHQITQLFQNLVSNALKFSGCDRPIIHISLCNSKKETDSKKDADSKRDTDQQPTERYLIKVQDNGIGIDPEQQERIFSLFQRLHTRKESEGYGIGLAICKKIIERHHGQIWVESSPQAGSVFYFTFRPVQP